MGLSRRAYAAWRKERGLPGGSDAAVRKAIDTGRISILPDGTIDPVKADAQWAEFTDPSQQRGAAAKAQQQAAPAPAPAARDDEPLGGGGLNYQKAKTALTAVQVRRQNLRLRQEQGDVVDRKRAEQTVFDFMRKVRDHFQQLPARVAAQMAAEFAADAHQMERALDAMIREHLALLSDGRIDLTQRGV